MKLLDVKGLSLTLGARRVLCDIDFSMERGAFQLIIGPNGAGKSCFLKCILHLFHDYSGAIRLDGTSNHALSDRERARKVAYVPQFLEMQFNLDVWSFMELSRYAHEDDALAKRVALIEDCLRQTDTLYLRHAFLDQLSGGERQRVFIAAALAQQPRLLILDEPTHSLDPAHRGELVHLLAELYHREQLTILLVTHDWNAFAALDPEVFALKQGKGVFNLKLSELDHHLESLFDCRFHYLRVDGMKLSLPVYSKEDSSPPNDGAGGDSTAASAVHDAGSNPTPFIS